MIFGRVTAKWGSEARLVCNVWVATHTKKVLDATFGWQTVVIPSHRIENRLAGHTLVTRNGVGVGVRKDVTHVQRTADCRRWRVN